MAVAAGGFRAWMDRAPDGEATLRVTGTVTLPTPGHTAALVRAAEASSAPDDLRLRLDVQPPDGLVAQVLTDAEVAWSGPADGPADRPYATVSIAGVADAIPVETVA
jgi:hypothetical protein